MSSLSFLSKKSWHTGLQSNQEAVWKAEKAALEERKKLDELRKERERERELEELERLNVESGGKKTKRQERVDWMYQVPANVASSSSKEPNKEELEEYLLGKKRVDKLLSKGDETNTQNSRQPGGLGGVSESVGSSSKTMLGGGDANSDKDLASKIREDPMFAIRQQEQAAYQALLKDPARLRAMRKAAGMDVEKSESKEERRRRKDERRRKREEEEYDRNRHSRSRQSAAESRSYKRDEEDGHRSRRRDEDSYSYRNDERRRRRDDDEYDKRVTRTSRDSRRIDHRSYRDEREYDDSSSRRSRSPRRLERRTDKVRSPSPPKRSSDRNQGNPSSNDEEGERQRKLEAMQKNAEDLSTSRTAYLTKMKEKEDADLALEESLRAKVQQSRAGKGKSGGFGGGETKGSFLLEQERSLYGAGKGEESVNLEDRLRRGRDTLQKFEAD